MFALSIPEAKAVFCITGASATAVVLVSLLHPAMNSKDVHSALVIIVFILDSQFISFLFKLFDVKGYLVDLLG
jgi:hypothetical protein